MTFLRLLKCSVKMKNIITTIVLLLIVFGNVFPKSNLTKSITVDEAFAKYRSDASWREQRIHLDAFAEYLATHPDMIGYIFVVTKENESLKKSKTRINRSIKYLTQDLPLKLRVEKSRIVVIYTRKVDSSVIILQPMNKDSVIPEL